MQNIHQVNLLKSREIIERHWICPRRDLPGPYKKKKYGDAFENDSHARLGVMMKIHSRFIAWPLNRFTRVESIQPGFQVLSNGHESIQHTRFNGFKFNRTHPVVEFHDYTGAYAERFWGGSPNPAGILEALWASQRGPGRSPGKMLKFTLFRG